MVMGFNSRGAQASTVVLLMEWREFNSGRRGEFRRNPSRSLFDWKRVIVETLIA